MDSGGRGSDKSAASKGVSRIGRRPSEVQQHRCFLPPPVSDCAVLWFHYGRSVSFPGTFARKVRLEERLLATKVCKYIRFRLDWFGADVELIAVPSGNKGNSRIGMVNENLWFCLGSTCIDGCLVLTEVWTDCFKMGSLKYFNKYVQILP